jgi:hypothetical protein
MGAYRVPQRRSTDHDRSAPVPSLAGVLGGWWTHSLVQVCRVRSTTDVVRIAWAEQRRRHNWPERLWLGTARLSNAAVQLTQTPAGPQPDTCSVASPQHQPWMRYEGGVNVSVCVCVCVPAPVSARSVRLFYPIASSRSPSGLPLATSSAYRLLRLPLAMPRDGSSQ